MLASMLKVAREGTAVVAVSIAVLSAPLAEAAPRERGSPAAVAAVEGAPLVASGAAVAGLGGWSLVSSLAAKSAMVAAGVAPSVLAVSAGSTLLIAGSAVVAVAGVALLGWGIYKAVKAYKNAKRAQAPPQPPTDGRRPGDPASPGTSGTGTSGNGSTTVPTNPGNPGTPGTGGGGLERPGRRADEAPIDRRERDRVPVPPPDISAHGANVSRNDATRAPGRGASTNGVRPGTQGRPSAGGASGAGMQR